MKSRSHTYSLTHSHHSIYFRHLLFNFAVLILLLSRLRVSSDVDVTCLFFSPLDSLLNSLLDLVSIFLVGRHHWLSLRSVPRSTLVRFLCSVFVIRLLRSTLHYFTAKPNTKISVWVVKNFGRKFRFGLWKILGWVGLLIQPLKTFELVQKNPSTQLSPDHVHSK